MKLFGKDPILESLNENSQKIENLMKQVHQMNIEMDSTISSTEEFISKIEKKFNIDSSVIIQK